MAFLIIIFIFVFLGWLLPRILPYIIKWAIRRRVNQFAEQMRGAAGGATAGGTRNAREPEKPARPKKKIDPGVGEYVRFEEITVETDQTVSHDPASGTTRVDTSVKVEDQIVDVEWEDLPPTR
ncbi:MAG: DUF4834 family protein [Muribaculaceae bacterium]|nr:DUF4834 family protein [Muribaculaceae bacterium]